MDLITALATQPLILTEAAISERLRRQADVILHPTLFFTPLIYEDRGREAITQIYQEYREIARQARLPLLLCAPTWRVDRSRCQAAGFSEVLNRDAVSYMLKLRERWQDNGSPVFVGGLVGPKNDCYQPDQGLSAAEAFTYHSWQVHELKYSGVEVVVAQTIPTVSEALGIARACQAADVPFLISFVIDRCGRVLDQTPLDSAIAQIDGQTGSGPAGYMVNCVHPSFLRPWFDHPQLFRRLIGIQANSSSLDHSELDGSVELRQDDFAEWGEQMLELHRRCGMKILGGCCGTDDRYLAFIASGRK